MRFYAILLLILILSSSCAKSLGSAEDSQSGGDLDLPKIFQASQNNIGSWSFEGKREIQSTFSPSFAGKASPFFDVFPCNEGLQAQSWDDLSSAERMLVNGYEILDENGDSYYPPKYVFPLQIIGQILKKYYLENGTLPEASQELYDWHLDRLREFYNTHPEGSRFATYEEHEANLLATVTSPVTGHPIEWNHRDFSAGNGFITIVNADSGNFDIVKERLTIGAGNHPSGNVQTDQEKMRKSTIIYYRAYGETGVLSEWFHGNVF